MVERQRIVTSYEAIDEQIRDARERVHRHDQLTRQRAAVTGQINEVGRLLHELQRQLAKEDGDVAKIERGGFGVFLSSLVEGKEDRLARERAEASAARERVNGQQARLEWLNGDLRAADKALAEVGSARQELDALLARKERMLVESADPAGRELADIARELAETSAALREVSEAYDAGMAAGQAVGIVLRHLSNAGGASTWDMLGGGGFADMIEHGHLQNADQAAWQAQRALDRFARELADIGIAAGPQLPKVDTRWFADMFFDNIITDALKHQRIARTRNAVAEVAQWVAGMVQQLGTRAAELNGRHESLSRRRTDLLNA